MKWKNVTDKFTKEQRYYNNKYLEIDEVYDDKVEVSLFSTENNDYEIYFSYDIMYGIIYVEKEKTYSLCEEVKEVLSKEYEKNKKVTDEFIDYFYNKYKVCLPNDIFFNFSLF